MERQWKRNSMILGRRWRLLGFGSGLLMVFCFVVACGSPEGPEEEIVILPGDGARPSHRSGERAGDEIVVLEGEDSPSPEPPLRPEPPRPEERQSPEERGNHEREESVSEEVTAPEEADVSDASEPRQEGLWESPEDGGVVEEPVVEAPPHTLRSWIGEPCRKDADCDVSGGRCLKAKEFVDGSCTLTCTRTCPDRAGKPKTFCISDRLGKGMCVSQCASVTCRTGYRCATRARYNEPLRQASVCVPDTAPPTGKSHTILYVADSQSAGTQFAAHMVAFFRSPRTSCPTAKAASHTIFSYSRVSSAARHWSQKSGQSKSWLCASSKIYTNGTASRSTTTGARVCAGITGISKSVFQKLIETHKPTAFFVQLGGNSAGFSERYVKAKVRDMLDQMPAGSPCVWVGPSYATSKSLAKRRDVVKWIQTVFSQYSRVSCRLISSIDEMAKQTRCSSFNAPDGLHMSRCGSKLWGEFVSGKVCQLGLF